jgi:hypothetical protein
VPKAWIRVLHKNGVRPALIPLLVNYFQGRQMKVKWHGHFSSSRDLNGGGPHGSTFGIWEYLSQSNENADCVKEEDRFKYVDDLSFLEIIYLINLGLSSYNVCLHVPSAHNQVVSAENLLSQKHLKDINTWTKKKKMKLNEKKTKNLIFNFTKKYQFTTKLNVNNVNISLPNEAKLLGTVITDKLTWDRNTEEIVKKAYKRMQLLHAAATFTLGRVAVFSSKSHCPAAT